MYLYQERVRQFHQTEFKKKQALYEQLHQGQNPETLFITCSDSRITPSELTQSKPGELFVIRNAGNLIPSYPNNGGESATIEYALTVLNIKHIIVCGHSQCGAMKGLLHPETTHNMPVINSWLEHAPKREDIMNKYDHETDADLLDKATTENVLLQIEHLKQYPSVKAKLDKDEITIHAWVYNFETGTVRTYNDKSRHFEPLCIDVPSQISPTPTPTPTPQSPPKPTVNNNFFGTFAFDCLGALALGGGGALLLLGLLIQNTYCLNKASDLINYGVSNISFFIPKVSLHTANNSSIDNELPQAHYC